MPKERMIVNYKNADFLVQRMVHLGSIGNEDTAPTSNHKVCPVRPTSAVFGESSPIKRSSNVIRYSPAATQQPPTFDTPEKTAPETLPATLFFLPSYFAR
jgi:hypothetical protein